jgi:hypothetical protein
MKPAVFVLGILTALVILPACERHSAQKTQEFLNAHKKHGAESGEHGAAHPEAAHADGNSTHAPAAVEPKAFFPPKH